MDPSLVMREAGFSPDPWQIDVLNSVAARLLLLCCRQSGKSTVVAALAILTAMIEAPALVLLLSPTLRQSGELFRDKVMRMYRLLKAPVPVVRETQLEIELANGSRIVSLPENEAGIRGFSSVRLLVIDEACRVAEGLYFAVRPMLAIGRGRLVAMSTPFGKRGWYYKAWHGMGESGLTGEAWQRIKATALVCPRYTPEFLANERRSMPLREFEQEYLCVFHDLEGSVFRPEDIDAAFETDRPAFDLE